MHKLLYYNLHVYIIFVRHGPFDILGGGGWSGFFFSDNIGARLFISPALRAGLFFS